MKQRRAEVGEEGGKRDDDSGGHRMIASREHAPQQEPSRRRRPKMRPTTSWDRSQPQRTQQKGGAACSPPARACAPKKGGLARLPQPLLNLTRPVRERADQELGDSTCNVPRRPRLPQQVGEGGGLWQTYPKTPRVFAWAAQ